MLDYSRYSDTDLLKLFQKGDAIAYREIYDRYWQLLFRFSGKLMQDNSIAEDIVQDIIWVLSRLFRVIGSKFSYN
ncbi:ECF sigma factor [Pedobacter sp. ok626]|nr:ECF sigma factor [Pedobacter sp. ok626]